MRVAFGTTVLERGRALGAVDGIGTYCRELSDRLAREPGLELRPFAYGGLGPRVGGEGGLGFGPFGPQALFTLASGQPFPLAQRKVAGRVDLVHASDHLIPSLRGVPVVATLMDAIPLSHPLWVRSRLRGFKAALWRRSARWADRVITISNFAKQELVQWFGLPAARISVIPLGVDQRWFVAPFAPFAAECDRVRQAYHLPERYFLFVGTLQPRKNLLRLIAAHRCLPEAMRRALPLVVIGRAGWGCEAEVRELTAGDRGALHWLRYVADADLVPLVSAASALVFPSLYEGFGLPVLEAMAAGVAVICSRTSSLPEVAGEAALQVDPLSVEAIATAMATLGRDPALAGDLAAKGRARAAGFTWERTAVATSTVYRQVLSGC